MYLSPFDTDSNPVSYQSLRTPVEANLADNKKVCLGGFSGSSSNYAMYKSNCFDLMKEHCAIQWDSECDQYVKSTNPKEEEMFRTEIASLNAHPLSSTNSCYTTSPFFPSQHITYGINPVLINNVVVPLSCQYSDVSYQQQYARKRRDPVQMDVEQLRQPYEQTLQQQRQDQARAQQQELESLRFEQEQRENERVQQQRDELERAQRLEEQEQADRIQREEQQARFNQQQKEQELAQQQEENARFQQQQEENARLKQQQEEMVLQQQAAEALLLQQQRQEEQDRIKQEEERVSAVYPLEVPVEGNSPPVDLRNPVEQDFYSMLMNPSDCKKSACEISKLLNE